MISEIAKCVGAIVGICILLYGGFLFGALKSRNDCRVAWNGGFAAASGYYYRKFKVEIVNPEGNPYEKPKSYDQWWRNLL